MPGPGHRVEISDSIELCIHVVELTRVDCTGFSHDMARFHCPLNPNV